MFRRSLTSLLAALVACLCVSTAPSASRGEGSPTWNGGGVEHAVRCHAGRPESVAGRLSGPRTAAPGLTAAPGAPGLDRTLGDAWPVILFREPSITPFLGARLSSSSLHVLRTGQRLCTVRSSRGPPRPGFLVG